MNSPAAIAPPATRPGHGFPIRYLLVFWLLVLSAVAFLDRVNMGIAGVQIGRDFNVDHAHLGWVFSAFLVGYASCQIPGGILARRFGPRRMLALSFSWWALFIILTALAPSGVRGALLLLVLVRFSLGAGEAVIYPAASQFVERWFPVNERGMANGIIFGGVGLGSGLTPPLLAAVILHYGWRASFWLCALIGIAAGAVWYLVARDTPEQHPMVSTMELQHIVAGRGPRSNAARTAGAPWRSIFSSKEVLALVLSYFTYGYVAWIFFSWFYIYLAEVRGLNLKTSAVYTMLPFLAMTAGCLIGGAASDWLGRRYRARVGRSYLPAFALGCTAILLLVGSRASNALVAAAVLACGAGTLYLSQSCFFSVAADIAGEHAGVVAGTINTGGQLGGAVTASLTPLIAAHFGWEASFLTAALLAGVGALAWLLVNPEARLGSAGTSAPATR